MDKRTVRRIVATALAVILAEQVFFLICGFGLPWYSSGIHLWEEHESKYEEAEGNFGKANCALSEEAEWLLTVTVL